MKKLEDLMKKLSKIDWTNVKEEDTLIGEYKNVECSLRMYTHIGRFHSELPAVQVLYQVKIQSQVVSTWGSTSEDDNRTMISFFNEVKGYVEKEERILRMKSEEIAKQIFKSI